MNHVVEISGAQCLELLPVVDHIDSEHRGGQRPLYLRLRWRSVTGRVVGRDWPPGTMTPVRRTL
jgi:hypothetical protein